MEKQIKVFGASLDAADFPLSIQAKQAYLNNIAYNSYKQIDLLEPYERILKASKILSRKEFIKIGKFSIDSWLTPKPKIEDFPLINQESFQKAIYDGIILEYTKKMEEFVKNKVFPGIPLMIGIDHSLTGGVLKALSDEYGAENILVIVFDAHFDGIPASLSLKINNYMKDNPDKANPLALSQAQLIEEDFEADSSMVSASYG